MQAEAMAGQAAENMTVRVTEARGREKRSGERVGHTAAGKDEATAAVGQSQPGRHVLGPVAN